MSSDGMELVCTYPSCMYLGMAMPRTIELAYIIGSLEWASKTDAINNLILSLEAKWNGGVALLFKERIKYV